MLKYIALAALILGSVPAYAADTITVTLTSDAPGQVIGPVTGTITFSQADMGIFLQALEASTNTATASAAASAWFQNLKQEFKTLGWNWQNNQALSGVVPINPN